jgi:hypothetical protein
MNNLNEAFESILGNPEMFEKVKKLASLFGNELDEKQENNNNEQNDNPSEDAEGFSPETMQMFMKVVPLLSSTQKDDKNIKLLKALKPLLSVKKQAKVDESIKIMRIMKILPLLKNQEIL